MTLISFDAKKKCSFECHFMKVLLRQHFSVCFPKLYRDGATCRERPRIQKDTTNNQIPMPFKQMLFFKYIVDISEQLIMIINILLGTSIYNILKFNSKEMFCRKKYDILD